MIALQDQYTLAPEPMTDNSVLSGNQRHKQHPIDKARKRTNDVDSIDKRVACQYQHVLDAYHPPMLFVTEE